MSDGFQFNEKKTIPLAEKLRPQSLEHVVGQDHLLKEGALLRRLMEGGKPSSIIFWGPPGTGKTTLAKLYAKYFKAHFEMLSGVKSNVSDLKGVIEHAIARQNDQGQATIVFMDEIHRYNRAQQDTFLPYVEDGTIILVGATTENPSFKLNAALLSRAQVLPLYTLSEEALELMLTQAEEQEGPLPVTDDARKVLVELSHGDGRYLLGMVEQLYNLAPENPLSVEELSTLLAKRVALYDQSGEEHYNFISALHKSVRGSDPDAALFWLSRMLEGGEDPLYLARRIIRMAYEDIGLADPEAVHQAMAAKETYEILGSPEGELALAQAVAYLALAPKSNAIYVAHKAAMISAKAHNNLPPPMLARNAPTKMMKSLGYAEGYQYDHDQPDGFSGQNYFPDGMSRISYYKPVERGFERDMNKRMQYFNNLRHQREKDS